MVAFQWRIHGRYPRPCHDAVQLPQFCLRRCAEGIHLRHDRQGDSVVVRPDQTGLANPGEPLAPGQSCADRQGDFHSWDRYFVLGIHGGQPELLPPARKYHPPLLIADFIASPLVGFNPLGVSFTDQSINSPTSWQWDFTNDGIVDSTAQNPIHIYPTPGTYTVKLTVSNAYGSDSKTRVNYIEVNVAPPDIIVTTWPYAIDIVDELDINLSNTSIYLWEAPIDEVGISFSVLNGTIVNVLSSISLPAEDFINISNVSITGGTLVNTLVSFSLPSEDFINITNVEVTSGTLVNALVSNSIPAESMDIQFTVLSGSLV